MNNYIIAIGKRKNAIARVQLKENGSGIIMINEKDYKDFFPNGLFCSAILQPLVVTEMQNQFDFIVDVQGGGVNGQAEAIRHGISLALIKIDENLRMVLRKYGFVTRDSRVKERKKYGLKGARKAPQFSKR